MDDDTRKVLIQRQALEMLVEQLPGRYELHWGPADEDGFYTPTIIYFGGDQPKRSLWQRLLGR